MADAEPAPVIRDRRAGDLDAVVDLALESLVWHAETFADIRPAPSADTLASAYRQLDTSTDSYFRVAELSGEIVGFLSASIHQSTASGIEALDGPYVYISDIVVSATSRRRGIARALMTDLDGWAADHGCRTLRLNMHAGNTGAQHCTSNSATGRRGSRSARTPLSRIVGVRYLRSRNDVLEAVNRLVER